MTAAPVTAEQAKQAAIKFLNHKSSNRRAAKALNLQRPILNAVSINERPMVYAFNVGDNDGFVLVSGSDLTDEVIGYSDHGTFDEQEMPDTMRSWLESYAKAVRQMEVNGKALNKTTKRPVKSPIAPMLTSKWNQNTPYNILCPVLPNGKRCATGCTNTAFAQIMYYHKWPKEATKAIPEYNINSKDTNYPIMPALEPTTFDWDKMSPTYDDNNENNVGKDTMEIAKLMLYVGCANMSYYGEQTSATGFDAIDGLKKYFGYDSNAQIVWRSMCNYEQWVDMLYAELVNNRPVPFSGDCKDNGHSFIIDGYDEEDYFHVNWGWGGMSDGYFKVSLLDPKEQGTGGSANNEAYSMRQVAFIGVQPPKGQGTVQPNTLTVEKAEVYYAPKGDNSYDALGQESSSPYFQKGYFIAPSILVYNNNSKNRKYDMGVRLIKYDQTYSKDYFWDTTDEIGVNLSYITPFSYNIYLDPNKDPYLTSGDYTMYFICRKQPSEEWLGLINWEKHYIKIHIDNDKAIMTSKVISDYPILDIPSIDFDTTPTAGNPTEVKFTLQNLGTAAYHGDIYV
ncbi:MAG: C10 family peptidase, partial [Prevotella sp.]|nr:C10 family peptidase [Prevotella sp.]